MSPSYSFNLVSPLQIPIVQELAEKIWYVVYPPIISREQIEFMLEKMYSTDSLRDQIEEKGHRFYLLIEDGQALGFLSFSLHYGQHADRTRLHKLYLLPDQHGKGLGALMLNFVVEQSVQAGDKCLELNVNKLNPALDFYTRQGFEIERAEVIDIGHGYVMDDFVMVKQLV